jgi:hypothetical protein
MEERKEANKQAMREDRHEEDLKFNNDLLAIAHNASFHLHHGARLEHFLLLQTFLSYALDWTVISVGLVGSA